MLTTTEFARLAISEEHAVLSLLVIVDLHFIKGVVDVFAIVFELLLTFRVFKEHLVFSFKDAFLTIAWVVSINNVRDGGCLDDRSEKFEDSFLDLPWCLV